MGDIPYSLQFWRRRKGLLQGYSVLARDHCILIFVSLRLRSTTNQMFCGLTRCQPSQCAHRGNIGGSNYTDIYSLYERKIWIGDSVLGMECQCISRRSDATNTKASYADQQSEVVCPWSSTAGDLCNLDRVTLHFSNSNSPTSDMNAILTAVKDLK